jgi:hypothetical protein
LPLQIELPVVEVVEELDELEVDSDVELGPRAPVELVDAVLISSHTPPVELVVVVDEVVSMLNSHWQESTGLCVQYSGESQIGHPLSTQ